MTRSNPAQNETANSLSRFSVRVYYEDTDAGGVVYYANYLRFAERARTEWLRSMGWTHETLLAQHAMFFVVRHAAVDYVASARLDDLLAIETEIVHVGASKLDMRQYIRQDQNPEAMGASRSKGGAPGQLLAEVAVTLVTLAPDGKVVRMPPVLREAAQQAVGRKDQKGQS